VIALGEAAVLGGVCGMRTFTGPAALAVRGRIGWRPLRLAVLAAAAAELAGDKHPAAGNRTDPPALAGRAATAALTGRSVAGAPGAAVAAAAAVASAYATFHLRARLAEHLPPLAAGAVEDALAITLALATT